MRQPLSLLTAPAGSFFTTTPPLKRAGHGFSHALLSTFLLVVLVIAGICALAGGESAEPLAPGGSDGTAAVVARRPGSDAGAVGSRR